mgnify:CR=1 FL=1
MPVIAQWPIYPAADPEKGYPSKKDFGEGYFLSHDGMKWFDGCYRPDKADWRYSPLLKSQAGMPPTLVQTASLDPIRDQADVVIDTGVTDRTLVVAREVAGAKYRELRFPWVGDFAAASAAQQDLFG